MRNRVYKQASMTIELSLLMPGILAVFILIIFTGYYIHDKCVIERAICSDKDFDDITSTLLGYWDISRYTEELDEGTNGKEISTRVIGTMKCFDGMFTRYLSKTVFSVDITETAFVMSGVRYIRIQNE